MADLLGLAARHIDGQPGELRAPNWPSGELSELAPGIALVESFSHVICLDTGDGLALFDTSLEAFGERARSAVRRWSGARVHTIAYTHGHVDHVGGAQCWLEEARERGDPRPRVVGHANLPPRFARYRLTSGYNRVINQRQFGRGRGLSAGASFGPSIWVEPDSTFRDQLSLRVGNLQLDLRHALGETDDHLWAWIPEHRAICSGDLMCWVFPNAGNPQKVQRYPREWALALREMIALEPELLLPAHGLPIAGRARIRRVLDDVARALESIVEQCLERMNAGQRLDELVQGVRVPRELLDRPYLQPIYDEPEFIVHNVWRLYGGWYDGNPAHLKPAPAAQLARELAGLAGGALALAKRGLDLAAAGELRVACELAELAVQAEPESREVHGLRAEIYRLRRDQERSLMARGIYGAASDDSARRSRLEPPQDEG